MRTGIGKIEALAAVVDSSTDLRKQQAAGLERLAAASRGPF